MFMRLVKLRKQDKILMFGSTYIAKLIGQTFALFRYSVPRANGKIRGKVRLNIL